MHGEDTTIVTSKRCIVIGVDTHLDMIHLAAITDTGQLLGDAEFRTNPTGYWAAITWVRSCRDVLTATANPTPWTPTAQPGRCWPATAWPYARSPHHRTQSPADRPPWRGQGPHRGDPADQRPPRHRPVELRERYRRYTTTLRLVQALARCRPTAHEDPTTVSVLIAARRWRSASSSSSVKPRS